MRAVVASLRDGRTRNVNKPTPVELNVSTRMTISIAGHENFIFLKRTCQKHLRNTKKCGTQIISSSDQAQTMLLKTHWALYACSDVTITEEGLGLRHKGLENGECPSGNATHLVYVPVEFSSWYIVLLTSLTL